MFLFFPLLGANTSLPSNGPSCIQIQGQWFEKLMRRMLAEGTETIEATSEAADQWVEKIRERWEATLLPQGKISTTYLKTLSSADTFVQLVDWCQYSRQEGAASELGGWPPLIYANA